MIHTNIPTNFSIRNLPSKLTVAATKLPASDHRTLNKKREWLENYTVEAPKTLSRNGVTSPVPAVLVFAQEEAGTAICTSPNGVILTCSHCVAETEDELDWGKTHWLLFASGMVVAAKTVFWDPSRDLAILIITRAPPSALGSPASFPFIRLSPEPPRLNARLMCFGHPGAEDLEASIPGVKTNYDTLVMSLGTFKGMAPGQDPQDNAEIGAFMHDCWTYWGHSGAPLLDRNTGALVALHSSWDDETAMRRGVPWEALDAFFQEIEKGEHGTTPEGWRWHCR
uniref:AT hook domain-containing protein family protein n=1 Tax=Bionectria ochroleuca TaxID=29856 RepID=A0A8H7NH92_BIOOC